jgi:predicted nuclease with RNAse H fold
MADRRPQFVGVDLASQPEKSSLCVIEWDGKPRVTDLVRPATDDAIVERALIADATGIDCPLGWPTPFVETIRRHHDGQTTRDVDAEPRDLRLRTTDQWLRHHHTPRDPLSVSTDRLGIVALRGIGILERLVGPGADRSGAAGVYEAYPGGTLAVWGLRSTGYKSSGRTDVAAADARREIVGALAPHVDLGPWPERLVDNADDLDAVITAVVAGLGHAGLTTVAPAEHRAVARVEGWIHVPTVPLDRLPAHPTP